MLVSESVQVEIEIIDDLSELRKFQTEWSRFVRTFPAATPFQTPEWLVTWWAHRGSGSLRVMAFREGGELVGVLPCFVHEWRGRRQLTLIGSGVTDDLDPLFRAESVAAILKQIRAQLERWHDWDVCDWQDLSADTPLRALGTTIEETPCAALRIEPPFERFFASRPKDLRRNLRRYKQRAEAIAPVTFDATATADPTLIDTLVALHASRWNKAGEPGMIQRNQSEAFLRDVAQRLAERGSLLIFSVRWNGSIAAILFAPRNSTTLFAYLSAFDPRHEQLGFGRELLLQALRYAHENGYRRWSFLRGEEAYKFSWGAQRVPKCRVILP